MSKKCPILQAAWLSGDDFTRTPHITKNVDTDCMRENCAWWGGIKCSLVKGQVNFEKDEQQ